MATTIIITTLSILALGYILQAPKLFWKLVFKLKCWWFGVVAVPLKVEREMELVIKEMAADGEDDGLEVVRDPETKVFKHKRLRNRRSFVVHCVRFLRGELGQLSSGEANKLQAQRTLRDYCKTCGVRTTDIGRIAPLALMLYFESRDGYQLEATQGKQSSAVVDTMLDSAAYYLGSSGRNPSGVVA